MRLFALSDIHLDFEANRLAIRNLSLTDYRNDLVILAGDVSHRPDQLAWGFRQLVARFGTVCFVPGNHDLWVDGSDFSDSVEKYRFLCRLARDSGVHVDPVHLEGLSIVPLLGWYDYSFGLPGEELRHMWMDFRQCRWPDGYDAADVTVFFLRENRLDIPSDNVVISFSHFLPRIDLMPGFIPRMHRLLYPVLGSDRIERQIRALGARIHVYGHSHVNRHTAIDGVDYINNAYGYPDEGRITAKTLRHLLTWNETNTTPAA